MIRSARGLGFMIGVELQDTVAGLSEPGKPPSIQMVNRLHAAGLLTIPAGATVFRLLPALNLTSAQAEEGLSIIRNEIGRLA